MSSGSSDDSDLGLGIVRQVGTFLEKPFNAERNKSGRSENKDTPGQGRSASSLRAVDSLEDFVEEKHSSQYSLEDTRIAGQRSILRPKVAHPSTAHPAFGPQESFLFLLTDDKTAPIERRCIFGIPSIDIGLPRRGQKVS